MIRLHWFGLVAVLTAGVVDAGHISPAWGAGKAKPAAGAKALPPPPAVKQTLKIQPLGLRLGITADELANFYDKVFDREYLPLYKKASIGPQQKALDAALADEKSSLRRGKVEFGTLPTGVDNTPLRGEYSYKNNETMMSLERKGVTRYFFFVSNRLWKIYDAIKVAPAQAEGAKGKGGDAEPETQNPWVDDDLDDWSSFKTVAAGMKDKVGAQGRSVPPDGAQQRSYPEVDWVDGANHIRLIDRSDEGIVGFVVEERAQADRLAAIKAANKGDEGAIDPSIQAVTRPGQVVDPNERAADAYTGRTHINPGAPASDQGKGTKKR